MTVEIRASTEAFVELGKAAVGAHAATAKASNNFIQEVGRVWRNTRMFNAVGLGLVAPELIKAYADAERHEAEREHRERLERENLKCHLSSLGMDYVQRARMWERQCLEVYFAINGNYRRTATLLTLFILMVAILGVLQ